MKEAQTLTSTDVDVWWLYTGID